MGFKSVMKKIGKVALKVAPIAAGFIPGVGPLASMAIGAGAGALDKKISGGSGKDMLIGGLTGGAMGYGGSKLASGIKGAFGKGANAATSASGGIGPSAGGMNKMGAVAGMMGPAAGTIGALGSLRGNSGGGQAEEGASPMYGRFGAGGPMDQANPNLAYALQQGKREGIMNQPFRSGGPMYTENPDDAANPFQQQLPPIQSLGMGGGRKMGIGPSRKARQAA